MRFPKFELDIDQYMQTINGLLSSDDCHLFIDTNIISQLYKLNDDARSDFFRWVSSIQGRFHIPNWVVHEYQKRFVGQKTKDYLSELDNKDVVKRLKNLSTFSKGYIGDSLLVGSIYQGKKDDLFKDLDEVADKFEKIHEAITKRLPEHQLKVHADLLQNLQQYTMSTDFYAILKDIKANGEARYSHIVPPGFEDSNKEHNGFGDLIVWREILDYCDDCNVTKAIWITRDAKPDIAYAPQRQFSSGIPSNNKIAIAHESLVYEFFQTTGSEDFYIIDFMSLAKCLASNYQELAISFQIVTTPEQRDSSENMEEAPDAVEGVCVQPIPEQRESQPEVLSAGLYSEKALSDKDCEEWCDDPRIKLIINGLKSYNWYRQNDAISDLIKEPITVDPSTTIGRDMVFVLGRNIYQSADGSAYLAINFIEHLSSSINKWDVQLKQALVDGMLYEVFFNSKGEIRPKGFKGWRLQPLLQQIDLLDLESPYQFISSCLHDHADVRFVPEVHSEQKYVFDFDCVMDQDGRAIVRGLTINGAEVTTTLSPGIYIFASPEELTRWLSGYYAVAPEQIEVSNISPEEKVFLFTDGTE